MPFASTPVLPHVDATADVANEDRAPAEVAATTAHAATRPTIVTTTGALRRDRRDDSGFATSGAACDANCRGDGEGRRPRALDLDENGLGSRACCSGMGSRRTAMLGFTFRGSRVSEFLSVRVKRLYSATARRSFSVVRARACELWLENAEC